MKNIQISAIKFVLFSALFLTLTQNMLFVRTVAGLITITSFSDVVFISLLPIAIFLALNICLTLLSLPYLRKPLIAVFCLIGPVIVYYMYTYNVLIDTDMLRNTFQTDIAESSDLISAELIALFIVLGVIPAIFVFLIKIKPERSILGALGWRVANIVVSTILVAGVIFICYKDAASFFRNNKWTVKQILPSNYIGGLYNLYAEYKEANRVFTPIGLDAQKGPYAQNSSKPLLFVIVVGETARSENFSLAGYERVTNPFMQQEPNLLFQSMTACNTSTATSLPCMFSDKSRKDYRSYDANYRGNVLDIIQNAGDKVFWVENDGGCKGICDRVLTVSFRGDIESELCDDGNCWDDIMLPEFESFVQNLDEQQNAVIVLHQIGSHGPYYYKRYPPTYEQFLPTCDTNIIKDCDRQALVNTYDNTILYTDAFLNSVTDILDTYSDDYDTAMLYVSDHGESLGENGLYLHATPYLIAPSQQLEVPFMLWLSDEYTTDYAVDRQCVEALLAQGNLSHDNLFHTIMGIMDTNSTEYNPKLDLVGVCR